MQTKEIPIQPGQGADSSWKPLYRAGALSGLVFLVLVFVPLVLLMVQPQVPIAGGAAILEYIGEHRAVYLAELVCFVGLSLPAFLVFLALGVALAPLNKSLAAIGALVGAASEIIALALGSSPPSLSGPLWVLSNQYAAAGEALRPSLVTAAEALAANANAVSAAGILTALGILLLSALMTKGLFGRATAILGIVTGALGMVLEALRPLVGMAYALYGILLPIWFLMVALGLRRLGKRD
jgi:hypothetical protein